MWKKIKPYAISIAISLGTGALAAFFTRGNMNVYSSINKPPLAPPGVLFPIVWTVLYVLMGISSAIVYGEREVKKIGTALDLYRIQLAVNFLWSIIFFNVRAFFFAFLWLVLLWVLVYMMIKEFEKISSLAAKLQIPYLLWITFAMYLNYMVYFLNR